MDILQNFFTIFEDVDKFIVVLSGILVLLAIFLIKSVLKEINQQKKIKKLNDYKSDFLSIISHQIKNPLVAIRDYSSLLSDQTIIDRSKINDVSLKIQDSADKLLDLLNNFLDFGRMEDGKMSYDFKKIELNKLLKDIKEDFTFTAQRKNLNIEFEAAPEEIFVKGDIHKLAQVFKNLVDNAIKYTKQGFVKMELIANRHAYRQAGESQNVLIIISDSGSGIKKELLSDIFKKFVRAGDEKEILGSGLGLYVCKEIVEAHNGKIWAESDGIGKGSKFYVELPRES